MEEAAWLLIAQISSSITLVVGFIALVLTIRAASGLLSGTFQTNIWYSALFLVLTLIGVTSMTFYHITEGTEMAETLELIWYLFIFLSLIFSLWESYQEINFGKLILPIEGLGKKKKK